MAVLVMGYFHELANNGVLSFASELTDKLVVAAGRLWPTLTLAIVRMQINPSRIDAPDPQVKTPVK